MSLWWGMRGCQQEGKVGWTWYSHVVDLIIVQIWYCLPIIAMQALWCVTLLCPQVGGYLAALLTLGWALWFFLVSGSTWVEGFNVLYLASLPCHLPWEEHIPSSQVAAGPRMRDVWKVLAPTCSLRLSSSVPEQEISPIVVHHQNSFLFFWSHNIIVAEIWPIKQPRWLMYPFIVQKTEEGARVISNVGNKSISLRVM